MTRFSFYDHDATQSECAHRLRCTVVLVAIVAIIHHSALHHGKRKWPQDGHSKTISSSTSREVGRHIKVQRSSFRLNVVLLIIMIMFFRAFIWWAITYFTWNFYWIRLFMRGACLNTVILLEKNIVPTKISAGRARWPELRDQQLNWTNRQ